MAVTEIAKPRVRAQAGSRKMSYSAAERGGNFQLWRPSLKSADADLLGDAPALRSRARDLYRNHPYAKQAVRASRLGVIGRRLRYSCRPDHKFLGIDIEESIRWSQEFERVWETYAHSHAFHVDASRRLTFTRLMALAHDCLFTDGEALVAAEWDPDRKWRSCFQVIDVDRLSNPWGKFDTDYMRSGVELDDFSAPVAYHIRDGHPGDVLHSRAQDLRWTRVERFTPWGRPVIMHAFEQERAAQSRGVTQFASVIHAMKMGQEYTETALQQAILQASYAAVLTSQQNYKDALEIIGATSVGDEQQSMVDLAQENLVAALEHHSQINLRFNGSQIPVLWPGEDLKMVTPGTGAAALGDFQAHATREYAAGTGTNPIDVSQNYANVNYSSAKMAAVNSYRHYEWIREGLAFGVGFPIVGAFLEEVIFSGALDLPKGVSPLDFYDAQDALIRGKFLTQGAPMLEPVKERQGQKLGIEMGLETLQDLAASEGKDYLDILDQQERENHERQQRGLAMPMMGGVEPAALPGEGDEPTDDPTED